MPNTHSTLTGLFTDIADAIREKDGTSTRKVADAFPAAIRAIPSGGDTSTEDALVKRTISGAYTNARVSEIGAYAFAECRSLSSVSFPNCRKINNRAFEMCLRLSSISFPECSIIGMSAFAGCSYDLVSIYFPKCIEIVQYAFNSCSVLQSASLPLCEKIGVQAFAGCNIRVLSLPNCYSIGSSAFKDNMFLNTVRLPAIRTFGGKVFTGCSHLMSLYLYSTTISPLAYSNVISNTPIGNNTAYTSGVYGSIFVPMSLLSAYKSATNWTYFADRFVGVEPEDM